MYEPINSPHQHDALSQDWQPIYPNDSRSLLAEVVERDLGEASNQWRAVSMREGIPIFVTRQHKRHRIHDT